MHSGYALAARLSETRPRLLSGTRGPRERADITSGPRRSRLVVDTVFALRRARYGAYESS